MSLYSFPITETASIANITTFKLFVKLKSPEFEKIITTIRGIEDEKEQDKLKDWSSNKLATKYEKHTNIRKRFRIFVENS